MNSIHVHIVLNFNNCVVKDWAFSFAEIKLYNQQVDENQEDGEKEPKY